MKIDTHLILDSDIIRKGESTTIKCQLPFEYNDLRWIVYKTLFEEDHEVTFKLENGRCISGYLIDITLANLETKVMYIRLEVRQVHVFGDFLNIQLKNFKKGNVNET